MSPKLNREILSDGSFVDGSIEQIAPDQWRPHGVRYRLAWVQDGERRVLFDNHHGKGDHFHIDDAEYSYTFRSIDELARDFAEQIRKLGGQV